MAAIASFAIACWLSAWLSTTSFAADNDYRIGAGDVIRIGVFDHPELTVDLKVSESGNITVPSVGSVKVVGLSTHQIEQLLATRFEQGEVLHNAQVTVNVLEYLSQRVAVMGQVGKPGHYSLSEKRTVMDMLAMAGGAVAGSAADEITLIHQDGTRTNIDLRRLFNGDLSVNATVKAGDTLFIPRAPQFYIYGEVQRPGMYRLERNMSLSQAIAAAGGLTPKGTERGITIKRSDKSGKERRLSVKKAQSLQADDVILVKESLF